MTNPKTSVKRMKALLTSKIAAAMLAVLALRFSRLQTQSRRHTSAAPGRGRHRDKKRYAGFLGHEWIPAPWTDW